MINRINSENRVRFEENCLEDFCNLGLEVLDSNIFLLGMCPLDLMKKYPDIALEHLEKLLETIKDNHKLSRHILIA